MKTRIFKITLLIAMLSLMTGCFQANLSSISYGRTFDRFEVLEGDLIRDLDYEERKDKFYVCKGTIKYDGGCSVNYYKCTNGEFIEYTKFQCERGIQRTIYRSNGTPKYIECTEPLVEGGFLR